MIIGYVTGQELRLSSPVIAADSVRYLEARFLFRQSDWDDLSVVRAVFAKRGGEDVYSIPLTDNEIRAEDDLNLSAGVWAVHLVGSLYAGGELVHRITTEEAELIVKPCAAVGGGPFPDVPATEAERLWAAVRELQEGGGSGGGTSFEVGNALELDEGVLNVVTTDTAEAGNDLPITSNGVFDAIKSAGNDIVCAASGDVVTLDDASDRALVGLRLFGRSVQNGTATPDDPVPVESSGDGGAITVIVEGGGTLSVPTPNGLPGIPVSSGGNYTDDSGQQWVCDEIDLGKGVYIRRVGVDIFTDKADFSYRSSGTFSFNTSRYRPSSGVRALCNYGYRGTVGAVEQAGSKGEGVTAYYKSGSNSKLCYLYDPSCASLDALGLKLAADPLVMAYNMTESEEIQLSPEELAAYWTLCTIKPKTTIYTDCGSGLEVSYVADAKAYIDAALEEAKASGEFDGEPGEPGVTPHIGANGNWFVGDTDTGVPAQGDDYVLTAQDKADIAQMAVDLLPKYNGEVEDA